jgi:hypothetical protein
VLRGRRRIKPPGIAASAPVANNAVVDGGQQEAAEMLVRTDISVEEEIDLLLDEATKTRRGSPERGAQVAVVAYLRTHLPPGSIVAAVKNEHGAKAKTAGARARFGAKRKAEGVRPGFPDLIIILPCPPRLALVEMKAPKGGRLSPAQIELHRELADMGFPVFVARSVEEARDGFLRLGVPLRQSRLLA